MARGQFDAYAVTARAGPHVTLQAGVLHCGRHWTTARRDSVKASAISRLGRASATTADGTNWRVLGGVALALDAGHPSTLANHLCSSTLAGGAMLRLGFGRLDQLLGYAEAGDAVPMSFLPTGRVLLVVRIRDELVLDGDSVVRSRGRWAGRPSIIRRTPVGGPWEPDQVLADVPDDVAALAWPAGPAWLGVATKAGAVALPAWWDPATGRLRVGRDALSCIGAELPGPICVTLDDSASRRPDRKLGLMLRGTGGIVDLDERAASVRIHVERVTYWRGFASTTTSRAA